MFLQTNALNNIRGIDLRDRKPKVKDLYLRIWNSPRGNWTSNMEYSNATCNSQTKGLIVQKICFE